MFVTARQPKDSSARLGIVLRWNAAVVALDLSCGHWRLTMRWGRPCYRYWPNRLHERNRAWDPTWRKT